MEINDSNNWNYWEWLNRIESVHLTDKQLARLSLYLPLLEPNAYFSVYDPYCKHPAFELIRKRLGQEIEIICEFNFEEFAALTDLSPNRMSHSDLKKVIRGIWKSDRVGFYRRGDELLRVGYIHDVLIALSEPKSEDAVIPKYPSCEQLESEDKYLVDILPSIWKGYDGMYEKHSNLDNL